MMIMVTTIITTLLNLAGPSLQGKAIDAITINGAKLSVDYDSLIKTLVLMGIVYLVSAFIQIVQGIASAKISVDSGSGTKTSTLSPDFAE